MSELNMALLREALRERDEARAALTAETANANAYAHQRDEARAEVERLKALLVRAVKCAIEDRAVTPGATRLARLIEEVQRELTP